MWRGTYGREVPGRVTEDTGKNRSGPRTRVSQGWLELLPSSELRLFPKSSVGTGVQWCDPIMPRPLLSLPANFPCRAQKGEAS